MKGFLQGDLLSPSLFLMVGNILSGVIEHHIQRGVLGRVYNQKEFGTYLTYSIFR